MYREFLNIFAEKSKSILGENLIGIYLHGSLVFGCFNPLKSDIDLILVVKESVSKETKRKFMDMLIFENEKTTKKGIELSIVKEEYCKNFVYPTPFELHFSNMHLKWYKENHEDYIEKMQGTDKDLAAHFTVINHCGITLYGAEKENVFFPVPKENYIDSILCDIENAKEDILENPVYMSLNLCRVLCFLEEGKITSKKEGGEWGFLNLPNEFSKLISDALASYISDKDFEEWEKAKEFAEYMLSRINKLTDQ